MQVRHRVRRTRGKDHASSHNLPQISWDVIGQPLMEVSVMNALFIVFFMSFMVLAVLNIITAIFVEGAVQRAQAEKEGQIQEELANCKDRQKDRNSEFVS